MTAQEKVVESIRHILQNPKQIKDITRAGNEYYFNYKGHLFSVLRRESEHESGRYTFYLYPKWNSNSLSLVRTLERTDAFPNESTEMATFHSAGLETPEAEKLLGSLFNTIENEYLGVDAILDHVLNG